MNSLELRPRFHIGRFEPVARAPLPLAVLLLLALSGCASIVHTVATELDLNTVQLRRALENSVPAHAHAISDAKDRKILARHRLSRDEKTRWRLQRLVDGIVSNSHKKQMRLQVRLLDDPTPNAFVTGAGYVYVFQGLLDQVESEDEIATILGHEIAHIDAGHIARRMRTQFWTSLALVTADALTKGETADEIIKAARALIPPAFSRNHEREADILGTIYAGRTGFEPTRINDFFRRSWAKEERMRAAWESDLRTSERSHRRATSAYQSALANYTANQTNYNYSVALLAQKNQQTTATTYQQSVVNYVTFVRGSSPLFRSHPVDRERIQTVSAVSEYATGRRSLRSFSKNSRIYLTVSVLNDVENRERALPLYRESQEELRAGDAERALVLLNRAVGEDPKYAEAWTSIGDIYMNGGEGAPAASAFERARSVEPREFRDEWKLGWAYAATGRKCLAVQEFERAVHRDKKNASLRVALGDAYTRMAKPRKALKQYEEATDLLGTGEARARIFAKMATAYEALGKTTKALESLQIALQQDPHCGECRHQAERLGASN